MQKIDEKQSTWYKKYQPQTVDDLILPPTVKNNFKRYVKDGILPPLALFSSKPGTGKSSTANAIIKDFGGEALWINASLDNSVDLLRNRIQKFASSVSFDDGLKIVVMDEFDGYSKQGQNAYRGFIDEFGSNCSFIFTGNYKENVIDALIDRLENYDYNSFKREDMIKPIFERLCFILKNEQVEYDEKDLVPVISTFYPCIRSMIGALQQFSDGPGSKLDINQSNLDNINQYNNIMDVLTPSTYFDMIEKVNDVSTPDNMYSFLYKNGQKYFQGNSFPKAIVTIAKYQHMSAQVRDKNLNLSACLTELISLKS